MDARTWRWKHGVGVVLGWLALTGCDPEATAPELEPRAAVVCRSDKNCAGGEYCATAEGSCGREGVCTPLPADPCDRVRDPVCGCDGVTYENACFAAAEGESVDFDGECPPPVCDDNSDCAASEYCAKPNGACGGTGTCEPRPLSCSGVWNPVCGCNAKTYANGCKAALQGVNVAALGAC